MTPRPSSDHRHAASRQAEHERQPRRSAKGTGAGMPRFLQRRALEVDAEHSPLEREADAVAEQVMRMPAGALGAAGTAGGADERPLRRAAEPGAGTRLPPAASPAVEAALGTSGRPLSTPERLQFEPRLGADLSQVQIHTDGRAAVAARALGAKAFAHGSDIYFGAGRFAPHTGEGRRLLAHELAHTLQASGPGLLQADFQSDFAGRNEVRVADSPVRPQGTIRVNNAAGEAVYVPYNIYRPQDVPEPYRDRVMDSTQAVSIRNPGVHSADLNRLILSEGLNQRITVEHMRRFAESLGSYVEIRVIMARVDNDFRFVGWDQISSSSSGMYAGFVESQVGTGGVGRALFADRVVRALQSGVPEMNLEMYTSQRTETFHTEIYRVAGLSGRPSPDVGYTLNTRQMARVALAWSDGLSEAQRFQLVPLAAGAREPTPAEAQRILGGSQAPGSGSAGAMAGGFASDARLEMQRFAEQVNRNVRQPAQLERLEDLHRRDVQERLVRDHAGFASVGQRLYRVQWEGDTLRAREVMSELIWRQAPSPPRPTSRLFEPLMPFPMGPLPVALDPARHVRIGSMLLEPPTETRLVAGDIVIVHSGLTFEARDARSGRPLVGTFEGGEWYRVLGPDGRNRQVDPVTGEGVRTIQIGGRTMLVEPFGPQPVASPRGVGTRAVAGGVGLIMIANEILGFAGAALRNQRAAIAEGEAEIKLWDELRADPLPGMWDVWGKGPASASTTADTALFGTWYYPYVVDIDGEKLRAELPRRVRSYYELQILLDSARPLGAIQERWGRWYAVVNRPARSSWKIYDITDAIRTVESLTLGAAEAGLRERLAATPEGERKGRIFRIKPGATLHRSQGGLFNRQPLHGAGDRLGPNALVREIRRTDFVVSTDRIFVEPVNADAYRAVALAAYRINDSIEDIWEEVKDSGREVTPAKLPRFGDGPLNRFTAGPETEGEQRFGYTTYIRDPGNPGARTAALGEIRKFWVSVDDVTRVKEEDVADYLR
jgi:Domain of unknown function (DUF4157)